MFFKHFSAVIFYCPCW